MQNAVPASLPPGLMVIEKIISPEEERRMLESIDWKADEDTQNGGYNYRNPDILYFHAGFFPAVSGCRKSTSWEMYFQK